MARLLLLRSSLKNGVRLLSSQALEMPACEYEPPPYKGPDYNHIRQVRGSLLNPALLTNFSSPLLIYDGYMQWLFDHTGKRYLDLFGGIVTISIGHCHPKVVAAATEQINRLWHTTNIYLHPKVHEYAERLTQTLPGDLKVVYFVNSGSDANDLAMMMARLYTKNFDLVSLRNSYHGASPYTSGLTASNTWKYNFANGFGIHHAANPDPYNGLWGGHRDSPVQSVRASESELVDGVCSSAEKYVRQLEEICMYSIPKKKLAGFFAESIQGVGGTVQFPLGYLKKAFELVRSNGGVCISDEVQTGFGRTGEHFWGFEGHDVIPDIVTMAKGIGNGFPLAAVVTTPDIAKTMTGALHFNTFGGNPISSAVGLSVLEVIEEEKIQQNSLEVGTYFLQKLAKLREDYTIVGDVRGKGLMIGIEMVQDKTNQTPLNPQTMMDIWDACRDLGVILGRGGLYGTVFRIKPPMCITHADVDFTIAVLQHVLDETTKTL
ncbi:alanine--glyoxylate aminotransferase 2, mitochondrial-like isoform X2 [Homarus americanus]|uniref:alanine--glyoxylate aminotransferase 2, mitochondrial-like isoform X2 n=1 Tax=Homarus americanus TaxID=6706 RepID=UPI001C4576EA|nr:alanine--glyoxylate aminotransferase 2, mitochondrial-like isoform X2 [Homarus americanus]